jgi:hypothetical protein
VNDHIKATSHPINVQPKKMFTSAIGAVFLCDLANAMNTGKKYSTIKISMSTIPTDSIVYLQFSKFLFREVLLKTNLLKIIASPQPSHQNHAIRQFLSPSAWHR